VQALVELLELGLEGGDLVFHCRLPLLELGTLLVESLLLDAQGVVASFQFALTAHEVGFALRLGVLDRPLACGPLVALLIEVALLLRECLVAHRRLALALGQSLLALPERGISFLLLVFDLLSLLLEGGPPGLKRLGLLLHLGALLLERLTILLQGGTVGLQRLALALEGGAIAVQRFPIALDLGTVLVRRLAFPLQRGAIFGKRFVFGADRGLPLLQRLLLAGAFGGPLLELPALFFQRVRLLIDPIALLAQLRPSLVEFIDEPLAFLGEGPAVVLEFAALLVEFPLLLLQSLPAGFELLFAPGQGEHLFVVRALDGAQVLELRLDGGEDLRDPFGGSVFAWRVRRLVRRRG
jgi:hypothetical protein